MARAQTETAGEAGAIQLIAHKQFADAMSKMFEVRDQLTDGGLTDGEVALGCRDCLVHRISDKNARPALANDEQIAAWELLFNGPDHGFEELFLYCPAMARAAASGSAGHFPCQPIGLMPIANT